MARLTVREGTAADWPFVEDLGARVLDSSRVRGAGAAEMLTGYERLLDAVRAGEHRLFVAQERERAVGFLLLLESLADEVTLQPQGFIAYMAVEPGSRRSGVGASLLARAEDEAKRHGLPYISLMVTEGNEPAVRLYESAGYFTERRLLCKRL
ncbi:MAG: GNAT family N-acetyltransferase [Candidatus Tyrphobacter sp.]